MPWRRRGVGALARAVTTVPQLALRITGLVLFLAAPAGAIVEAEFMVPVRDGTELATTVFRDEEVGTWPVVLIRTPYDKSRYEITDSFTLETIAHGYALVVQDTRGRYASGGTDSTFWTDGWGTNQDGFDTIEWIAAQSWCDGNVGMFGGSALGITQLLAAGALPPALKACFSIVAADDFYHQAFFQGGAFRKSLIEGWMNAQGAPYMIPFFTAHPTRDAFWDAVDLETRAPQITVPIFHLGGHYDIFGDGAIHAFNLLNEQGGPGASGNQRLVMGPWQHTGAGLDGTEQGELNYPPNSLYDYRTMRWRWFDRWLKGIPNGVDEEPPVEFYLMGDPGDPATAGNIWIEEEEWPPPVAPVPFYFTPSGNLSYSAPSGTIEGSAYVYDPDDPVPTLGGRNLNMAAGPYDQRPLDGRSDRLEFLTHPLSIPIRVVGQVTARLYASSSALDTDWTMTLIDVYPDGRKMLVTDGILRARFRDGFETEELMEPDTVYPFDVDLWSTAIAFDVGHRIGVVISSSNHPRFDANPNDGLPFNDPHTPVSALNRVELNAVTPSHIVLPVYSGDLVGLPGAGVGGSQPRLLGFPGPGSSFSLTLELQAPTRVRIGVYDVGGREIRRLGEGPAAPGRRSVVWDGRRPMGAVAPPGVYFLRAQTVDGFAASIKLILLR